MLKNAQFFERAAVAVSALLLAVLFGLMLIDVVLRWLRVEFYWGNEAGGMLMAWLIFLALPMVIRARSHISTDFLVASLSPKSALAIRVLGNFMMVAYLIIVTWLCTDLAHRNFLGGTRAQGILRLPSYYIDIGVVFGLVLMVISQILTLIEDIRSFSHAKGGEE